MSNIVIIEDGELLGYFGNAISAYQELKEELLTQFDYMDEEFRYQVENATDVEQLKIICENYDLLISVYELDNEQRNTNLLKESRKDDNDSKGNKRNSN